MSSVALCASFFFFSLLVSVTFATSQSDAPSPYLQMFDVKPGGVQHEFSMERDGIKCTFTYVCQGGTNEKWRMLITQIHEVGTYGCVVERESGTSYLFFQSFTLALLGEAEAHQAHAFGNGGRELKPEEFKFDKAAAKVQNSDKFGAELARLALEFSATGKRSDL
ncbi:hypothetical protein BOX15_Mlig006048g2 [Macrostomum lignano]|uniref:Myeloid-derived growth factor n=1 Tax=Macrostomum lignano TaxID=282301 RepID=A0A267DPQ2_9PLAT|nr:hypothetical protein BOX15_Mlig006048g1 [Macrostomum lignano]PAA83357.1 hypothetical protein BOX15_Mlig006048g2 [Macrostomum lignano]